MKTNIEDTTEEVAALEIYLSTDTSPTVDDDGLVWKEVLREGTWAYRPGAGQVPTRKPLKVVAGHASDLSEIGFADLITSFEAGAIDHVTIPTSHEDKPEQNTGFVEKLEVRQVDGSNRLYAGMNFTEPDIKEKALRGTIANTSVGVVYDYIKKSTGEVYKQALGHIALTNKPWINNMAPFGLSEDGIEGDDVAYVDAEPDNEVPSGLQIGDVADFDAAKDFIIQRAKELGNLEWLPNDWQEEITADDESVSLDAPENNNGDKETKSMSQTPEEIQEEKDRLAAEQVASDTGLSEEAVAAMIEEAQEKGKAEAEAKFSELEARNKALEADLHEKKVAEKIVSLKGEGFSEYPGLLKAIEELLLADEGSDVATLTLSEEVDGKVETSEVKLSVSDIVTRITDSMPKVDEKVNFGEQANDFQNFGERPSRGDEEVDPVKAADELNARLGRTVPTAGGN